MGEWLMQLRAIGEVALAAFLGGIIGTERMFANKPAGARTHALVSASAALLMTQANLVAMSAGVIGAPGANINLDPTRVVQAIITGVGFIGAGAIFRRMQGEEVEGLTTAASVLLAASIGITVSLDRFILAVGITVMALILLRGGRMMEVWLKKKT